MIEVFFGSDNETKRHCYRIAGDCVSSDIPLPAIAQLPSPKQKARRAFGSDLRRVLAPEIHGGAHPISGILRQFQSYWNGLWLQVQVESVGTFQILNRGRSINSMPDANSRHSDVCEVLLGAPMVLALAMQEIFCLHASAVRFGPRAIAFIGESGTGKSTLAAALIDQRICDDILPVRPSRSGASALPHFPQLKLQPEQQYPVSADAQIPLHAVFVLEPIRSSKIEVTPLSAREAALQLIRHTVASRLFHRTLLSEHWDFAIGLTNWLQVFRVQFPHRYDCLPALIAAIKDSANFQTNPQRKRRRNESAVRAVRPRRKG